MFCHCFCFIVGRGEGGGRAPSPWSSPCCSCVPFVAIGFSSSLTFSFLDVSSCVFPLLFCLCVSPRLILLHLCVCLCCVCLFCVLHFALWPAAGEKLSFSWCRDGSGPHRDIPIVQCSDLIGTIQVGPSPNPHATPVWSR